jgi:hypothetical protein
MQVEVAATRAAHPEMKHCDAFAATGKAWNQLAPEDVERWKAKAVQANTQASANAAADAAAPGAANKLADKLSGGGPAGPRPATAVAAEEAEAGAAVVAWQSEPGASESAAGVGTVRRGVVQSCDAGAERAVVKWSDDASTEELELGRIYHDDAKFDALLEPAFCAYLSRPSRGGVERPYHSP